MLYATREILNTIREHKFYLSTESSRRDKKI